MQVGKVVNKLDATKEEFSVLSSTCFGHQYAQHQEYNTVDYSIRGVSKKLGEWYQKTNKTEDTNKSTLFAFKIIAILHNTLLASPRMQNVRLS
jgi:hypothetical protein